MPGFSDRNLNLMRKSVFLDHYKMQGIIDNAGAPNGALTAGVLNAEVGATGLVGWDMNAGEFIGGGIPIPRDLDPRWDIGFRVHYTGTVSGTTGTNTWLLLWKKIIADAAYAVAATALDTVIAADPFGANLDAANKISPRGILLATTHKLTRDEIENGAKLMLKLELDVHTNCDSVEFVAIEMDYVPMMCVGAGSEYDRPLKSTGNDQ
jgi:hypothetical protein